MSADIKVSGNDEELKYWKHLAEEYKEELERLQKESDEFMIESKQLEKEYECTIDQNERKIKELTISNNRAQNEVETLRIKLEMCYKDASNQQTEIDSLKNEKKQLLKRIVELEKCNDDLEQSKRILEGTMADFKQSLNTALEQNALLADEVDEKEGLQEKLKRAADEARDLKQELEIREKKSAPDNERFMNGFKSSTIDNRLKETETQTMPGKRDFHQPSLTPASRVMAINIVSDLIRKVGSLERRLDYRELQSADMRKNLHATANRMSK
ncbi:hypothetical protein ABEB36_014690 [Hypothenemus hampei]|uniref:NUDE domain-containing protein n=1 Tax=Hypothenemus hampei TaxID=57062 RepID=A0ABD1E2J6_HYPHA